MIAIANRIGIRGAIIGAMGIGWGATLFTTYADMRVEGPLGIGLGYEGHKPFGERMEADRDIARADLARVIEAQAEAKRLALEAIAERARQSAELARKTDDELDQARRDALADARAYIDRMRPQAHRSDASGAIAPGQGGDTSGAIGAGPAPVLDDAVIVEASDVLICTENTIRLESAQEWASGLGESG